MRKILPLLPIALCFTAAAQNTLKLAPQPQIYISQVTVIDTETGKQSNDQTVVIAGDKISHPSISSSSAANPPQHETSANVSLSPHVLEFSDLNTRDFSKLNKDKVVVIIPGGILEEHGPYLPSGTDAFSAPS